MSSSVSDSMLENNKVNYKKVRVCHKSVTHPFSICIFLQ